MGIIKSHFAKVGILQDVKILVVDNDVDNRYLYSVSLQELAANVTTTGSIKKALDLLDWLVPDILVSEIKFPGESVDPLMQRLKCMALANRSLFQFWLLQPVPQRVLPNI